MPIVTQNSQFDSRCQSRCQSRFTANRQMSHDSIKSETSNVMKISDLRSKFMSSRLGEMVSDANTSAGGALVPRHLSHKGQPNLDRPIQITNAPMIVVKENFQKRQRVAAKPLIKIKDRTMVIKPILGASKAARQTLLDLSPVSNQEEREERERHATMGCVATDTSQHKLEGNGPSQTTPTKTPIGV